MPFHIDVPPPHVDVPPAHVDVPPPHVDIPPAHVDIPGAHVDVPPPHIDIPPPHVDIHGVHVDVPPPHIDVPPPHVDLGHVDLGHVDLGHVDLGHVDLGHVDIAPFGSGDNHADAPHVDAAPPHVDVGYNHWWQNWPKTHAYVASRMLFPTSVAEIASGIQMAESLQLPLKAVGGGWSFSEASLPGNVVTARATVQTSDEIDGLLPQAEGFPVDSQHSIASLDANNGWLTGYDPSGGRHLGGARRFVGSLTSLLPQSNPQPVIILNTSALKSTLQATLRDILSPAAVSSGNHYFHVEAGITIEELDALLLSQSPPLQTRTSQGNPGATIAGSIQTATHGAEFNATDQLMVDRVRAVHLVGPGGHQWWIEGNIPIASPAAITARYGIPASNIITGTAPVMGITPQNWLDAVVVSMGTMGVIYSVVLECAPYIGAQQVTQQTTWNTFLAQNPHLHSLSLASIQHALLNPTTDPNHLVVASGIVNALMDGSFSGGLISSSQNNYADLAFNPNPAPAGSHALTPGDFDVWIVNRRDVPMPFDPQPPAGGGIGQVVGAVFNALAKAFGASGSNPGNMINLVARIADVYGLTNPAGSVISFLNSLANPFAALSGLNNPLGGLLDALLGFVPGAAPILQALIAGINPAPLIQMISRVANAHDMLDVALDALTQPLTNKRALDLAQPFLTGFLASALGTTNETGLGVSIGTSVGSLGFPSDGIVGTGLEVAMPVSTAFGFLQNQILNPIAQKGIPFYGYVSVRICKQSQRLLAMQQWPISVMMEVVSFGDDWGKEFVAELQKNVVTLMAGGADAMLHWGLENDQLRAVHLAGVPSLHTKLPLFNQVRALVHAPGPAFRVFNNAFTQHLGLTP